MELSNFLAQLFGLTLALFALAGLLRPQFITSAMRDLREGSFSALIAGFVGIFGGLAMVLTHNIWEVSYRGVITLFGWGALLKGFTYIVAPNLLLNTARTFMGTPSRIRATLIVVLVLGFFLAYKGFGN